LCNSKAGFCHEHNSVENTDFLCISQGFLQDDTVRSDVGFFDLKNGASIVAIAFYGLHNDKYTLF
jgi:hypothetical protein